MHPTIQTSTQIIAGSMFGSSFIHEHHSDESNILLLQKNAS